MSSEQEHAQLVRLVKERSQAKARIAVLETELRKAGEALHSLGSSLRHMKAIGTSNETPGWALPLADKALQICGLDTVRSMLVELKELQATLEDLDRRAKQQGVD